MITVNCSHCSRTDLRVWSRIAVYKHGAKISESAPFCATCFLRLSLKDVEAGTLPIAPELEQGLKNLARLHGLTD